MVLGNDCATHLRGRELSLKTAWHLELSPTEAVNQEPSRFGTAVHTCKLLVAQESKAGGFQV